MQDLENHFQEYIANDSFTLYYRLEKGPTPNDEDNISQEFLENKQLVIDATLEFLVTAVTSTKAGLVFHDPTYGTSGSNQNHLIFNLITNINEPWTRPNLAKVVIAALGACPDLIRPYFIKVSVIFLFFLFFFINFNRFE